MIKIYTDWKFLKENEVPLATADAELLFNSIINEIDFKKYDSLLVKHESALATEDYPLIINYENKTISNCLGSCSFYNLGTGWKLFFVYLYLAKQSHEDDIIEVMDLTSMGNNLIEDLLPFLNEYEIPVVNQSFILDLPIDFKYQISLNDHICGSYLEFFGLFDKFKVEDDIVSGETNLFKE